MTITTYTDREIALKAEVERLKVAAKYAEHTDTTPENQRETMLHDLITERDGLMQRLAEQGQFLATQMGRKHFYRNDAIALRQQLAEAQALIEASRKQEAVAWFNAKRDMTYLSNHYVDDIPLFAVPVVADDVLKDAQRYRWLRDNSSSISWNPSRFNAEIVSGFAFAGTGYLGFNFEDAINAAMGGAND